MEFSLKVLEDSIESFKSDIDMQSRAIADIYEKSKADLRESFIVPTYSSAALKLNVSILTPQGLGLFKALKSCDLMIEKLTVLHWNGVYEQEKIAQAQQEVKEGMKKIFKVARQIILGMNNKVQQMAETNEQVE